LKSPNSLDLLVIPPGLLLGLAAAAARGCGLLEHVDDGVVGGVLLEVLEPEEGGAFALEDEGDPAEGIVKVPEG